MTRSLELSIVCVLRYMCCVYFMFFLGDFVIYSVGIPLVVHVCTVNKNVRAFT